MMIMIVKVLKVCENKLNFTEKIYSHKHINNSRLYNIIISVNLIGLIYLNICSKWSNMKKNKQ